MYTRNGGKEEIRQASCLAHSRNSSKGLLLLLKFKAPTQAGWAAGGYGTGRRKGQRLSLGGTEGRQEAAGVSVSRNGARCSRAFPDLENSFQKLLGPHKC